MAQKKVFDMLFPKSSKTYILPHIQITLPERWEAVNEKKRATMPKLTALHHMQMKCYAAYREGDITIETYLAQMKPVDEAIARMEMATLRGIPGVKEACEPYIRKQETPEASDGRSEVPSLHQ